MKSCFLRSDFPGSPEGQVRARAGSSRGTRGPTDTKGEGSDGEVGQLATQENTFSLFPPAKISSPNG